VPFKNLSECTWFTLTSPGFWLSYLERHCLGTLLELYALFFFISPYIFPAFPSILVGVLYAWAQSSPIWMIWLESATPISCEYISIGFSRCFSHRRLLSFQRRTRWMIWMYIWCNPWFRELCNGLGQTVRKAWWRKSQLYWNAISITTCGAESERHTSRILVRSSKTGKRQCIQIHSSAKTNCLNTQCECWTSLALFHR